MDAPRGGASAAAAPPLATRRRGPRLSLEERAALIPGLARWVDLCNNGADPLAAGQFVELRCRDASASAAPVGYVRREFAKALSSYDSVFRSQGLDDADVPRGWLEVHPDLADCDSRTRAIDAVLRTPQMQALVEGWREELYPVAGSFGAPPLFLVERAAAKQLGIKAYGVHVNGYVVLPDGSKELWVARRSATKPTWPGKLDHIVAGGQPHNLSCAENVVKECEEEASIPPALGAAAAPVGAVSYTSLRAEGLGRDVLFCFDLQLPLDFVPQPQASDLYGVGRAASTGGAGGARPPAGRRRPRSAARAQPARARPARPLGDLPTPRRAPPALPARSPFIGSQDGEVQEFGRLPLDDVAAAIARTDDFKDNCNLVIVDFLLRHGYLTPDMPDYLALLAGLRAGDLS
eukprot:scaffold4.g4711.t1